MTNPKDDRGVEPPTDGPPFPPDRWILWPVSDSSTWADRPPVSYEDGDDVANGCDPPPEGVPLPDEASDPEGSLRPHAGVKPARVMSTMLQPFQGFSSEIAASRSP